MKWIKKGIVFDPKVLDWAEHSALQPTPIILNDRVRVFFGARDAEGVSRIGYVDLDLQDPAKVIDVSKAPVLDIGGNGCFDENGVVPSAVVENDGRIYLYYAGYQLGMKVRFTVFGGLAISEDGGKTFVRYKKTPVFERTDNEILFRVPHSVVHQDGIWRAWYGGGSKFIGGAKKSLPIYDIRYVESPTPYSFSSEGKVLLRTSGDEYRLGRPYFFKKSSSEYYLFYGYSTESETYRLGYAFSIDGVNWEREDKFIGIDLSLDGWDSEMMAYPSVVEIDKKIYMFYNGNNYGYEGFGLAELEAF